MYSVRVLYMYTVHVHYTTLYTCTLHVVYNVHVRAHVYTCTLHVLYKINHAACCFCPMHRNNTLYKVLSLCLSITIQGTNTIIAILIITCETSFIY